MRWHRAREPELCVVCEDEETVYIVNSEPVCRKCMTPDEWDEIQQEAQ